MTHKTRGYKRETPVNLLRDYKLFAISCEGGVREPNYFKLFTHMSGKIAVDIIEDIVSDFEMRSKHENKSAPKWVLDRAIRYIEKEGLLDEDDLWFVMDTDRWSEEQLREIAMYCEENPNWNIVLSNPCFEVWLYFHKKTKIVNTGLKCAHDYKSEISTFDKGGYHPFRFIPFIEDAIKNAKAADTNSAHYFPNEKETKVYKLGEALIEVIGKNDFDKFIKAKLPELKKAELEKARVSKRKKA
jgi:hypothetical protein